MLLHIDLRIRPRLRGRRAAAKALSRGRQPTETMNIVIESRAAATPRNNRLRIAVSPLRGLRSEMRASPGACARLNRLRRCAAQIDVGTNFSLQCR